MPFWRRLGGEVGRWMLEVCVRSEAGGLEKAWRACEIPPLDLNCTSLFTL